MTERLSWIEHERQLLEQQGLLRVQKTRESPPVAGLVQIDGRQFINFGSNDYLGLASHEALVRAVEDSIGQIGFGAGASPLVNGRGTLHRRLERELADFEGTESVLLFPTGFAANVGVIGSLVSKGDTVFSDQLNHASIIDGCRLSGAAVSVYPHLDMQQLESQLADAAGARRRLIVTDGLFSMDGDFAKLGELCELSQRFDAMLMVDEAHATGVFGANGRGACEMFGVEELVDVRVGTLSKAFGCIGGFVTGSKSLIEWIWNNARPQIFSTAQPEVNSAAALAALKLIREEPDRREKVIQLGQTLRNRLKEHGFEIAGSESQIVPVILGENEKTMQVADKLAVNGIYVPAIRSPSVPVGQSRLRLSICSDHTEKQLEKLVENLVLTSAS